MNEQRIRGGSRLGTGAGWLQTPNHCTTLRVHGHPHPFYPDCHPFQVQIAEASWRKRWCWNKTLKLREGDTGEEERALQKDRLQKEENVRVSCGIWWRPVWLVPPFSGYFCFYHSWNPSGYLGKPCMTCPPSPLLNVQLFSCYFPSCASLECTVD